MASPANSDRSKHPSALSVDQHRSIFVKSTPLTEKLRIHRRVKPYSTFKGRTLNESARLSRVQISLMLGLLLPQLYQWISFPALPKTHTTGSFSIAISIVIVISSIGLLLSVRDTVFGLVLGLAYMFASLLYTFSVLYWGYGSASNFSIPLSHLDAIYFAIGTLTTAGTGNILPLVTWHADCKPYR